jgi:uncharacterized protein with HEPN domain
MIEACRQVMAYTAGMNREALVQDRKTYDATVRNLEILGEAAKGIPEEIRTQNPQVSWRDIAGFRDVLSHAYFGIDEDLLGDVVFNKTPVLLEQLEVIANSLKRKE